ncbi:MAG: hypothetical protein RBR43_03240 [Desulfuromonadaceae bacterium]|nr:hypothetical protein [Desulfuromonas sp.]MDY0184880.1 hypothetical protein [Desulfuromonadaceae bacterium]
MSRYGVFHNEIKHKYALYDFVIVGIVNEDDPHGVFNVATLQRIDHLTHQLIHLKRGADGMPRIELPGPSAGQSLALTPDSRWERLLNTAFGHSPNDLFTPSGSSAIVAQEILSPSLVH